MVTAIIGKIFLQAYNEKYGTNYSPKEFFLEVYYPLFFDHEKYLMTAGNSPLENPKLSWSDMILGKKPFETIEQREGRLSKFLEKIDTGIADASIAVGFPSVDPLSTTSGQVSMSQKKTVDPSESYLSWFGSALAIGVQGGVFILFNNAVLLLDLFEGWKIYRQLLDSTPMMKGNQINTWNAHWIKKKYSRRVLSTNYLDIPTSKDKNGLISIDTLAWSELLIALSSHFDNPKMLGYVYNIGQTNTTIGFIPVVLSHIRKASELYIRYFGANQYDKAEKLFGTALGLTMACREGVIGMKALEPKGLRTFMEKGKIPTFDPTNEERIIQIHTYQIWLLAMLNNEEMWDKAKRIAEILEGYSIGGKSGRTGRSNDVKKLLEASTKKAFIEQLTTIVGDVDADEVLAIASVINLMPADNVPYFLTLIRFHYAVINTKSK